MMMIDDDGGDGDDDGDGNGDDEIFDKKKDWRLFKSLDICMLMMIMAEDDDEKY